MTTFEQLQLLAENVPDDPQLAVVHVRSICAALADMAMLAADKQWPGFSELVTALVKKETELSKGVTVKA